MEKNWLGQTLEVGDYVYMGIRAGNGSEFRVGRILDFIESPGPYSTSLPVKKAKCVWFYADSWIWLTHVNGDRERRPLPVRPGYSGKIMKSSVDIQCLHKTDRSVLDLAHAQIVALREEFPDDERMKNLSLLASVYELPEYEKYIL